MRRLILAALLAALPITGHAESVLKVKPFGDVRTLDPVITTDSMVRNYGYMVYDTLFGVDDKLTPRLQMLQGYTLSPDGLTYQFMLREGLTFHDGAPVTSTDVVASLRRWGKRDGFGQLLFARVASLEPSDARGFTMVLKAPWGLAIDALSKPSAIVPFIMPARIAAASADVAITDTTGSGPFVFRREQWVPGSKIVFTKFPGYLPRAEPAVGMAGGKKAGFDRVEWLNLPDAQTAANALMAGEIDIYEEITPDLMELVKKRGGISLMRQDELGLQQVFRMNQAEKPFNNEKVRQAVRYAIDPMEYLRAWSDEPELVGRACPSFYMCISPFFTDTGWEKPDMAKARKLLAESGYDGTPVILMDPTDVPGSHVHVLVAEQMLRDMGMKTDLRAMDWATMISRRTSKTGWSVFISGPSGPDMMEPLSHMGLRSNCDAAWFGWPCDAEIERLRAQFGDTVALADRKKIAEQIQLRAEVTGPYWPVANMFQIRAYRSNLKGLLNPPAPVYWNITRE